MYATRFIKGSFNLPDSTDKIFQGVGERGNLGAILSESLPNIEGCTGLAYSNAGESSVKGAFYCGTPHSANAYYQAGTFKGVYFDASLSSSTYQSGASVQQNAIVCNYIIKY